LEVTSIAGRLRRGVLSVLQDVGPSTPDEIAEVMGESVLAIRPRCSELITMGQVCKTKHRRINRSGKAAAVLQLVSGVEVDE
jgi:predicted transcriptional regulator